MSDSGEDKKPLQLADHVHDMSIKVDVAEDGYGSTPTHNGLVVPRSASERRPSGSSPGQVAHRSSAFSSSKGTPTSPVKSDTEVVGGDITVKMEPGSAPKLSRTQSKKIAARPPTLFLNEPDATAEAKSTFEVIDKCTYANKYLGITDHALECDCSEEWDAETSTNNACGEDSDCINRATKMECVSDCTCGEECQNRRFQERAYADVSVIKTHKKGYGLRTNKDLRPNQLIYEYVGEVIGESKFRSRMSQYDEEGIKHFYFMSLSKGEFVDATRRGNLGRFCNHSCNPNCYVDKWVVGDRLRMGIFAERKIVSGEELVFNYNVDRYGANPQPCYCGEPNCTGFIGGKTQTERATKLSTDTIEALGIEDADDWDLAVAKKGKKKKTGEADEEYVDRVQPKTLEEGAVTKVMATLMQCKEKWIAVKLLNRIQDTEDERVRTRVVKMHGYRILKSVLTTFADDVNVVLQVFDILDKLPRITRNKIQDSKIEETVEKLTTAEDERVKEKAIELMKVWAALEVGYRIPRAKRDSKTAAASRSEYDDRRRMARERSRSKSRERSLSPSVPRGPAGVGAAGAPSGPRNANGVAGRPGFGPGRGPPPFRRPLPPPLPAGWFQASNNGRTYFYNNSGQTSWTRPTAPAAAAAGASAPASKVKTHEQKLQDIIESITSSANTPRAKPSGTSTPQSKSVRSPSVAAEPKWKSWPEEKQMKLYENTLFPHIKHVVNKYKSKLPNEDLKRFAKEISKKLVASDYKNKRVTNPSKIDEKQERKVKSYCKDFFEKAVKKQQDRQKGIADKAKTAAKHATVNGAPSTTPPGSPPKHQSPAVNGTEDDSMPTPHELDDEDISPGEAKRKRAESMKGESPSSKKVRTDAGADDEDEADEAPPPPPPPPPPPADSPDVDCDEEGLNGNMSGFVDTNMEAVDHNGDYTAFDNGSEEYQTSDNVNGHTNGSKTLDESRDIEVS